MIPVVDLDEPLRSGLEAAADAAIVIGVEDYAFVPDVPYAHRDAGLVHDWLVYTRGVPAAQVAFLTDPSREQILHAVEEAASQVQTGGTLWVYFAGHGAAAVEDGSRLLLGVDVMADPAVFGERGVRVDEIVPELEGVQVVAMLDTCYAGVGRAGGEIVTGKRFAVPSWASDALTGTSVWTAASANELAGPLDGVQHGAFTWLVVGALRGWADGEVDGARDGDVTLAEAHAYVGRALRGTPLRQQPELVVAVDAAPLVLVTGVDEAAPELGPSVFEAAPAPVAGPTDRCPFEPGAEVVVTMTNVQVAGVDYLVTGKGNRLAFQNTLILCGYDAAADYFRQWRATRRTTNSVWYPFVVPSAVTGLLAARKRRAFEAALVDGR